MWGNVYYLVLWFFFCFQEFYYGTFDKLVIKGPVSWCLIKQKTNFGNNHWDSQMERLILETMYVWGIKLFKDGVKSRLKFRIRLNNGLNLLTSGVCIEQLLKAFFSPIDIGICTEGLSQSDASSFISYIHQHPLWRRHWVQETKITNHPKLWGRHHEKGSINESIAI